MRRHLPGRVVDGRSPFTATPVPPSVVRRDDTGAAPVCIRSSRDAHAPMPSTRHTAHWTSSHTVHDATMYYVRASVYIIIFFLFFFPRHPPRRTRHNCTREKEVYNTPACMFMIITNAPTTITVLSLSLYNTATVMDVLRQPPARRPSAAPLLSSSSYSSSSLYSCSSLLLVFLGLTWPDRDVSKSSSNTHVVHGNT